MKFKQAINSRYWLCMPLVGAALLVSGCDSTPAIATVTARAVETNAINLTLTVVPTATPSPAATITPTGSVVTSPATQAANAATQAASQAPTSAATTQAGQGTSAAATIGPTSAVTQAATLSAQVGVATQVTTLSPTNAATTVQATQAATLPATTAPIGAAPQAAAQADTSWFKSAILYSVFVRSFRDSNDDGIGDLQGVIDGLDYIQSLGANTIWLLPVFKSPSYHGYDVSDYYTVNPDYGTNDDLIKLIREVHKRHMHILLDYVVNHTSNQHSFFKDALGNPNSQYAEFYHWLNAQHTQYDTYAGVQEMPTLNYDSQKVRQYVIDVALHWLDPLGNGDFSAGVDGYRCDDAVGPPQDFWAQLRTAMTAKNPQSLLLGEIWVPNPKTIATYLQGNEFNAAFDFPLYAALGGSPDQDGDGALAGRTPNFAAAFMRVGLKTYPPNAYVVRFVNNHDTNRVMSDVGGDMARARASAVLELTAPGVPMIYYGEELGMKGEKGGAPWYDAYRREPLPWYASLQGQGQTTWFKPTDKDYNQPNSGVSVQEEDGQPQSLLTLYRTLGQLRLSHPAFSSGNVDLPQLSSGEANLYELRVWDKGELLIVLINFSTQSIDWTPNGDWTVGSTTYRPSGDPLLMQSAAKSANGTAWTIQAAGYAIFKATAT